MSIKFYPLLFWRTLIDFVLCSFSSCHEFLKNTLDFLGSLSKTPPHSLYFSYPRIDRVPLLPFSRYLCCSSEAEMTEWFATFLSIQVRSRTFEPTFHSCLTFTHEFRTNSRESSPKMTRCCPFTHERHNRRSNVFPLQARGVARVERVGGRTWRRKHSAVVTVFCLQHLEDRGWGYRVSNADFSAVISTLHLFRFWVDMYIFPLNKRVESRKKLESKKNRQKKKSMKQIHSMLPVLRQSYDANVIRSHQHAPITRCEFSESPDLH